MRTIGIVFCLGLAVLLATVSSSRGDETQPSSVATSDTTAGSGPSFPAFQPYGVGPPEAIWTYEDLTADERVVADRGRSVDYSAVHDGYKAAVQLRSQKASADAAARKLGIETLETGIVP